MTFPYSDWTIGDVWATVESVSSCVTRITSSLQLSGLSCPRGIGLDSDWMALRSGVTILIS